MKTWVKILLILIVLGIIGAGLGYKFIYNKPHRDYEKAKADFTLPAKDLFEAYRNSKQEAEQKYNGKVIDISGKIKSVEDVDTLVIVVFAFSEGMFGDEGIRCTMLPKYKPADLKIMVNSVVDLKGYCTGYNDTDVILEKCSLDQIIIFKTFKYTWK